MTNRVAWTAMVRSSLRKELEAYGLLEIKLSIQHCELEGKPVLSAIVEWQDADGGISARSIIVDPDKPFDLLTSLRGALRRIYGVNDRDLADLDALRRIEAAQGLVRARIVRETSGWFFVEGAFDESVGAGMSLSEAYNHWQQTLQKEDS